MAGHPFVLDSLHVALPDEVAGNVPKVSIALRHGGVRIIAEQLTPFDDALAVGDDEGFATRRPQYVDNGPQFRPVI